MTNQSNEHARRRVMNEYARGCELLPEPVLQRAARPGETAGHWLQAYPCAVVYSPTTPWRFYVLEWDRDDELYGYAVGDAFGDGLTYLSLRELRETSEYGRPLNYQALYGEPLSDHLDP